MPMHYGRHSYTHNGMVQDTWLVDCFVGNFTSIAKTLTLVGNGGRHPINLNPKLVSTFGFSDLLPGWDKWPKGAGKGPIHIGSDVWIGTNVTLLDGITIGDGAIVGAGAVVAKDVQPFEVVIGNPIRHLRYRYCQEIIHQLLNIRWWDWPDEKVHENLELMQDVEAFVKRYGISRT